MLEGTLMMRGSNRCQHFVTHACAQANAARLKAYKANLVLFPRRSRKPKAGDAPAEELGVAGRQQHAGALMPITRAARELETVEITDKMRVRRPAVPGAITRRTPSSHRTAQSILSDANDITRGQSRACWSAAFEPGGGRVSVCMPA